MYGPTRTHSTWKPRVEKGDLAFLQSDSNQRLYLSLHGAKRGEYQDPTERSRVFGPDCLYESIPKEIPQRAEITSDSAELPHLDYAIVGGFENNAIKVRWGQKRPRWIALKTFTGVQVKYAQPDKQPPIIFALADEDAYCYCNEDPCKLCSFECKSGFILYAFYDEFGIVRTDIKRRSLN